MAKRKKNLVYDRAWRNSVVLIARCRNAGPMRDRRERRAKERVRRELEER